MARRIDLGLLIGAFTFFAAPTAFARATLLIPGNLLRNGAGSLWKNHHWAIIGITLLFVLESFLVLALLRAISQRKRTLRALERERLLLEGRVSERTAELEDKRQQLEEALLLRDSILDNALVSIILIKDRHYVWVNDNIERMFGYAPEEVVGRGTELIYLDSEDYSRFGAEFLPGLAEGKPCQLDVRFRRKDGRPIWCTVSGKALDPANLEKGILYIVADIDTRKKAEESAQALIAQKDLLLREVHHRVKNNLNTIQSLLRLQAGELKDGSAVAALHDAENRVASMALLYDRLYRDLGASEMSIAEYLPSLVDEIVHNFPNGDSVKVKTEIDEIVLEARVLQPLGILINELITNIMKYAFAGKDEGRILVSAKRLDGLVEIAIEDNGRGMPESVNFQDSSGFGLMLVGILTKQINGEIRIERGNGTRIVLELPLD